MQLDELQRIIQRAGGGCFALDYAEALLEKFNRIAGTERYNALIKQLCSAKEPGDFRGRVLEVNFADLFVQKGLDLPYGAKQGMKGDIDFCWSVAGHQVFIETKLLGQDQGTKNSITQQLERGGVSEMSFTGDTRDVARIQFDLIQKASTRKFNPNPAAHWINLVGVDVSELQLGTADIGDCLLAAGGNPIASMHCDAIVLRENVVGVFEAIVADKINEAQRKWISEVHKMPDGAPHPRDYIHGALFFFREPKERSALSYALSAAIVWNRALVTLDVARVLANALHQVIPTIKDN